MKFLDADAQSRAFVRASLPIFLFGLCIFIEGLMQPISKPVYDLARWIKILPILAAIYLAAKSNQPGLFNKHLDEFTYSIEQAARSVAGIITIVFLFFTVMVQSQYPWSYMNAVDCIVGVYMMVYSGYILIQMRDGHE